MYIQLPLQIALQKAFAMLVLYDNNTEAVPWTISKKDFPHPSLLAESVAGRVAPVFVLASLIFNLVVVLSNVVAEKENGFRAVMSTMGMGDTAYWISWWIPELLMGALHATVLTTAARAFQLQLVISNDFVLLLLLVFLTNTALISCGLAVSTLVQKSSMAVPLSFAIFIIAWVLQLVVYFGFPFNSDSTAARGLEVLFSVVPWTLLSKGILDLADATTGSWKSGITFGRRSDYCWSSQPPPSVVDSSLAYWQSDCHMPLGQIYWVLLLQAACYMILTLYLDKVVQRGEECAPLPWYFPAMPSLWMPKRTQDLHHLKVALEMAESTQNVLVDEDVAAEAITAQARCKELYTNAMSQRGRNVVPSDIFIPGLHIFGLRMVYKMPRLCCFNLSWPFTTAPVEDTSLSGPPNSVDVQGHIAVSGTWLSIPEGQCFCLLGPNGAGKTTTIKCLTGSVKPTGGDGYVYGHSIHSPSGMAAARGITGICPQFDVLFNELTALEHLMLYADLKGMPWADRSSACAKVLEKVALTSVCHSQIASFSGGMKRRLSVAIALLGDPKVLYLDEPSTGMDPVSRRQVWDLVAEVKQGRVVILTTHSMAEADILGDRIGIIKNGEMQCIGTSLRLKTRFGSGYRITICYKEVNLNEEISRSSVMGSQFEIDIDHREAQPRVQSLNRLTHIELAKAVRRFIGEDLLSSNVSNGIDVINGAAPLQDAHDAHEISYLFVTVPQTKEKGILQFLGFLEDQGPSLGVQNVLVGLTSLEEVYLKIVQKDLVSPN